MKNIVYEKQNCRITEKNGVYLAEQTTSKILGLIDVYEAIKGEAGEELVFRHFDDAKKFLDTYVYEQKVLPKKIKPFSSGIN